MTPQEYFASKQSKTAATSSAATSQPRKTISDEEMNRLAPAPVSAGGSDVQSSPQPKPTSTFGLWNKIASAGKAVTQVVTGGIPGAAAVLAKEKPKEFLEAGAGMVKNFAKSAIQLPQAFAGGIASVAGRPDIEEKIQKKRNVPLLGEVKPLSAVPGDIDRLGAQTSGETAVQAAGMYLEAGMPGAGRAVKAVKSILPESKKVAEVLSGVKATTLEKAADPKIAKAIEEVRALGINDSPEGAMNVGQQVFSRAQQERKAAMDLYKESRAAIVEANKGNILQRSKEFRTGVEDALKANGIRVSDEGVNLVGSQFEGSPSAQTAIERIHGIMTRPTVKGVDGVDDLLTRREAISSLLDEIPPTEKNLRRVIGKMRESFDGTLESVLGPEATALRQRYAESIKPSNAIIDAMTTKQGSARVFSPDRASAFIKQAASDLKFDKRAMLSDLDALTGTNFAQTVEAIGVDKAISQLEPATRGRVFDVLKTYVIGKLPVVSAFVSPKFWGELALRKGLKGAEALKYAKTTADEVTNLILRNLLTLPIREGLETVTEQSSL